MLTQTNNQNKPHFSTWPSKHMVLWLKLGKLIVIRTLKGRWNELVILSLGQTSALDASPFPQIGKYLKIKYTLLFTFLPLCNHSNDLMCVLCVGFAVSGSTSSLFYFVCKDFLGYLRQESSFVSSPGFNLWGPNKAQKKAAYQRLLLLFPSLDVPLTRLWTLQNNPLQNCLCSVCHALGWPLLIFPVLCAHLLSLCQPSSRDL